MAKCDKANTRKIELPVRRERGTIGHELGRKDLIDKGWHGIDQAEQPCSAWLSERVEAQGKEVETKPAQKSTRARNNGGDNCLAHCSFSLAGRLGGMGLFARIPWQFHAGTVNESGLNASGEFGGGERGNGVKPGWKRK